MKLWNTLTTMAREPHPQISQMANDIINYISNQVRSDHYINPTEHPTSFVGSQLAVKTQIPRVLSGVAGRWTAWVARRSRCAVRRRRRCRRRPTRAPRRWPRTTRARCRSVSGLQAVNQLNYTSKHWTLQFDQNLSERREYTARVCQIQLYVILTNNIPILRLLCTPPLIIT